MSIHELPPGEARSFIEADMQTPESFAVAGGVATVWSAKCPTKETGNEDAAAIVAIDRDTAVLIVADGCGGMAAGEVAARLAVENVVQGVLGKNDAPRAGILDGIEHANQAVIELGAGAGTTLVAVLLESKQVQTYHVGDSQVALVGGRGRVKLLTNAHSPVGYAVIAGLLDEQQALVHEDRHLVSNLIGTEEMHVEIGTKRAVAPRDVLVLSSDGLSDNLLLEELVAQTRHGRSDQIAERLGLLARQRMERPEHDAPSKPDDLTLIAYSRR